MDTFAQRGINKGTPTLLRLWFLGSFLFQFGGKCLRPNSATGSSLSLATTLGLRETVREMGIFPAAPGDLNALQERCGCKSSVGGGQVGGDFRA